MNTLKAVQDYGLEEITDLETELANIRKREDEILGELARRRAIHAIATAPTVPTVPPLAAPAPTAALSSPCPSTPGPS